MRLPKAELEHWMREYYFDCEIDLGSSGVSSYSFAQLREIAGITLEDLDSVVFDDSLTRGAVGLRQAIADQWGDGDANKVMVMNGSNEMLYHILTVCLDADDEVIVMDPIYHALSTVAEAKPCKILKWEMLPENEFVPCLDELESLISENTKMVCVNFPHNPTGISVSKEYYLRLIEIVKKHSAYLIWDSAFEEMVAGEPLPNPINDYDKAITVGTMSKGYGLPGIRIGWCFAPEEVLVKCVELRDYTTLYISPFIEIVAQKAIENAGTLLARKMESSLKNLEILKDWIVEHKDYVSWVEPKGGVTCLVKLNGFKDTEQFCRDLAANQNVMMVPGRCFEQPEYVRLGFGIETSEFTEGLSRLSKELIKQTQSKAEDINYKTVA